jgi:hypothetical protein
MKKLLFISVFGLALAFTANAQSTNGSIQGNSQWLANQETMPGNIQAFEENKGQFVNTVNNWKVIYGCDYQGTRYLFTDKGIIYSIPEAIKEKVDKDGNNRGEKDEQEKAKIKMVFHTVAVKWENAGSAISIEGRGEKPYYFGYADPVNVGKSIENVKGYESLIYHNVYPGIDVVYTFHSGKGIKYALKVKAGYSADVIKMQYDGQNDLSVDAQGDIHIATVMGDIIDHAPVSTQNNTEVQSSFKKLSSNEVGFQFNGLNTASDLIIDPWTVSPTTGGFVPVDVGTDSLNNTYIYGGTAVASSVSTYEQKYSSTGSLLWTYNYSMYPATVYLADMVVDHSGNSYVAAPYTYSNTNFLQYAMVIVNPSGSQKYFYNTYTRPADSPYDGIFETWNLSLNCQNNTIMEGGAYEYSTYQAASVNPANGQIYCIDSGSINTSGEVFAACFAPNGTYYGLTANQNGQDSLIAFNVSGNKITTKWSLLTGFTLYDYAGKTPVGIGTNGVAAGCAYLYTTDGLTLEQRNISTGAVITTVTIPSGSNNSTTGGYGTANGGIAVDIGCGYVYVGTNSAIIVYDQNLKKITQFYAPGIVYDVTVNNGLVTACGSNGSNGFVTQFGTIACGSPLSITSTKVSCGSNNGTASVTASFCTGPYSYLWSPSGQTTQTATGLAAGTYTVYVSPEGDCISVSDTVTIASSPSIIASITSVTSATCGNSDGSATVSGSGGSGSLTYSWAPSGGTNVTASNLPAGSYTVTVGDSLGCSSVLNIIINNSGGPTATIASTNIKCFGDSSGSATISATGGTGPYTYLWSPGGQTNATASNLTAGSYTCIVTDNGGCKFIDTITIYQPSSGIIASISSSKNSICGSNNGSASVLASGGKGPYKYLWAPAGGTNATANSLTAGTYTVTVTDANGCSQADTVSIDNVPGPSVTSVQNNICTGLTSGAAMVTATGGSAPYKYSWSPSGGTSATATGLSAGTYICTVTDANGCSVYDTVKILPPNFSLAISSATQPACNTSNGSITVTVTGPGTKYYYDWEPNNETNASATGLSAGTYTCVVTDTNGCDESIVYTLSNVGGPTVTFNYAGKDTVCSDSVVVALSGGTPPGGIYSGSYVVGGNFYSGSSNVGWNFITYTYKDSSGCQASALDSIYVENCVSGIATISAGSQFEVYPNPSTGIFNIKTPIGNNIVAEVYNDIGQLIIRKSIINGEAIVDLSVEAKGVYCLRFINDNKPGKVWLIIKQ